MNHWTGRKHSDATKERIRQKLQGRKLSIAHRAAISIGVTDWQTGRELSPEHREHVRQARLGTTLTERHRVNITVGLIRHHMKDET